MTQKWNLQDIRPAQPRKRRRQIQQADSSYQETHEAAPETASEPHTGGYTVRHEKKKPVALYGIIALIAVLGVGFLVGSFMESAEVTVYPKNREPNVNAVFEASLTPQEGGLPYEVMTLEAEGERQVNATGEEQVEEQAMGTITIYNEAQQTPLRLVTNTRFQSQEGLIFKISDPAVVPGYTLNDAGEKVPGTVTAEVYADEVGEEYNIGPSRFTVPGFEGEPEFETVYAESKTAFAGGYSGMRLIVEDEELQAAQTALREQLRNSLLERIDAEKPAGFVVFRDAVTFTHQSLPSVEYSDDVAAIKEKVYLRIPLFKEETFAAHIAQATLSDYDGMPVRINNYDTFSFSYQNASTSVSDITATTSITFNLTGKPQIVWSYDTDQLKSDLANMPKSQLPAILSSYPAIQRANAVIQPFWKSKFPQDTNDITITEVIEPQE